jgi:hypothetical protein
MTVEHFKSFFNPTKRNSEPLNIDKLTYQSPAGKTIIPPGGQPYLFCDDQIPLQPNNPNFLSPNQALAGPPNPKTKISPVVVPPPADLEYWRANNFIHNSNVNKAAPTDMYLSGYKVSNCCDRMDALMVPTEPPHKNILVNDHEIVEDYCPPGKMYEGISDPQRPVSKPCKPPRRHIISPEPRTTNPLAYSVNGNNLNCFGKVTQKDLLNNRNTIENFSSSDNVWCSAPLSKKHHPKAQINSPVISTTKPFTYTIGNPNNILLSKPPHNIRENFEEGPYIKPNKPGWVNITCGYNPEQLKDNLPSNLQAGNCEKMPAMKDFNKNLFTQTIQPDIYTVNEIIEPINSNIGISFTQQFEPTTCSRKDGKGLTYVQHDPRVFEPELVETLPMDVTMTDVYDPRFSGYGTSYRSYNDPLLGNTKFYYDDIDSIRMPNYITRSNIDFAKYADHYGPLKNFNRNGNENTNRIKALAQDTFLRCSLQQRTELQERLMRKRNSEMWQLRKYPKSNTAGMRKC